MTTIFKSEVRQIVGDTLTPVSLYLRLRDRFPGTCLLESADYQPNENCFTYICVNPVAGFKVAEGVQSVWYPDGSESKTVIGNKREVLPALRQFLEGFDVEIEDRFSFISNGLFGYVAFDSIEYFEDIEISREEDCSRRIPAIFYQAFEYLIAINHYRHEMYLVRNSCEGMKSAGLSLDDLETLITRSEYALHPFQMVGSETSNFDDASHREMIEACKKHVYRGDVFQIVPSRRFEQPFQGDEFNVYRALRVVNPSPYLFFFDFGGFRIFGSSPEAELIVSDGQAAIFPIAGTCPRTGDEERDEEAVAALVADPKENAEHVMLVDLARNDLSKHCSNVRVERYKEVHRYSHVIHLVSQVVGDMNDRVSAIELLADTFPAGTLSGAPKYRAMELIDRYERGERSFYSGAIGFLGFDGSCNHAIVIRSFLSKNNVLYRQAGGGVVADSEPQKEVEEVVNKLMALKRALEMAERLGNEENPCR
jgi:anthranilate synthase component 1